MPFDPDGGQDDDGCVLASSARSQIPRVSHSMGELDDRAHVASLDASAGLATTYTSPAPGQYTINGLQG
jgi:hypothetical protein